MGGDRFYTTSRWRKVRAFVLERDQGRCQIRGTNCTHQATEVDHIISRSQGGAALDPRNLRASCKECNNQRVDRGRREAWRTAPTRITLVWGPPAAGKSTYVQHHAQPGDIIVDFDLIAQSLGSPDTHNHPPAIIKATIKARNTLIENLRRGQLNTPQAWIVSSNRNAPTIYPHHTEVLIDPGPTTTHQQATNRPPNWHQLIDQWYTTTTTHSRTW